MEECTKTNAFFARKCAIDSKKLNKWRRFFAKSIEIFLAKVRLLYLAHQVLSITATKKAAPHKVTATGGLALPNVVQNWTLMMTASTLDSGMETMGLTQLVMIDC